MNPLEVCKGRVPGKETHSRKPPAPSEIQEHAIVHNSQIPSLSPFSPARFGPSSLLLNLLKTFSDEAPEGRRALVSVHGVSSLGNEGDRLLVMRQ